jgi:hypothetical protein
MTPIQYAIARAAKQMNHAGLLRYAETFGQPRPAMLESARVIVNRSAGETVTAPPRTPRHRDRFTFQEYVRRYGCFAPKLIDNRRTAQIESEWESRMIAEAEEIARQNRE